MQVQILEIGWPSKGDEDGAKDREWNGCCLDTGLFPKPPIVAASTQTNTLKSQSLLSFSSIQ
uniref:Uncharacterized protein n=1 Tax=Nelumbo nucifera TaxID=4432 RepID=A0A822ZTG4_NELNU|nr:TPA_asm: hypothetical protein HUJ06_018168 [Nelumbo nucifera]